MPTQIEVDEKNMEAQFSPSSYPKLPIQQPIEAEEQEIVEAEENESVTSSSTSPVTTLTNQKEDYEQQEDLEHTSTPSSAILIKWTATTSTSSSPVPPTITTTTTEAPTTTAPPPIFIIQKGESMVSNTISNQQVRVAAVKAPIKMPVVKQILHLDDYDQDMEDEEEEQDQPVQYLPRASTTPTAQLTLATVQPSQPKYYFQPTYSQPSVPSASAAAKPAVEQVTETEDEEDEEDDDDFFFLKPGVAAAFPIAAVDSPRREVQHRDPFEIVSHQETVSRR